MDGLLRLAPYPLVLGVTVLMFVNKMFARQPETNVFMALAIITVLLVVARQFFTLRKMNASPPRSARSHNGWRAWSANARRV